MTQQTPEPLSALPDEGLVTRLRQLTPLNFHALGYSAHEAATALLAHQAEIDRLRADVGRQTKALKQAAADLAIASRGVLSREGFNLAIDELHAALRESDR